MATLTAQDVMRNFTKGLSGSVLTGTAKINEAIKNSTKFDNLQDVVTQMIADCRTAGSAEKFMSDYCGITNENNGTFNSIYGFDLGGKTYEELLPQSGEATYPTETTFNKRGLIVTIPEESTLTDQQKLIIKGAYSWWIENAVKIVEETFNVDFNGETIELGFKYDDRSNSIATTNNNGIYINMASSVQNLTEATLKNYSPYGIAVALAHEMTHVAQYKFNMPDYVHGGTPKYLDEGMADLAAGRFYAEDIASLAGDADLLAQYIDTTNANYMTDAKSYEAGYLFWRYLMKQTADSYDGVIDYSKPTFNGTDSDDTGYAGAVHTGNGSNYSLGGGNDTLFIHGNNISVDGGTGDEYIYIGNDSSQGTILGAEGNDSIFVHGNDFVINCGDGNDYIYIGSDSSIAAVTGGNGNDSIFNYSATSNINSGADNDYISNFASNVTITSGAGDDTVYFGNEDHKLFNYNSGDGNDKVYNLTSNDTVKINGATFSTVESGYNVIVNVGSDKCTLFGAVGKDLTIVGQSGTSTVDTNTNTDTSTTGTTGTGTYVHTYDGGNKTISDYQQGQIIQLGSDYQGFDVNGNSFLIKSSSGQLEIQNARDKFIGYSAKNSTIVEIYSYIGGSSGMVDGRDKSQIEIMIGANNLNNQIYAGSGGSSMWGGMGGSDTLTGGNGYDEFFYLLGCGSDAIKNAESNDMINLLGVGLEQITNLDVTSSAVVVNFSDGGTLRVEGNSSVGYKVGDVIVACDQSANRWYVK